jgi:hypothetical protein
VGRTVPPVIVAEGVKVLINAVTGDVEPWYALVRFRDLNEAARAADASREANVAVYGERLK